MDLLRDNVYIYHYFLLFTCGRAEWRSLKIPQGGFRRDRSRGRPELFDLLFFVVRGIRLFY